MPDLMKTPSNRRYVVNFQQKEPKNKYDIWLSFNKHDEGGHIVTDSEYLAEKDLVFKIYMNGKWIPILGIPVSYEGILEALEELDKKKMNIVPPSEWEEGHIPIFQQGDDECDQLVDGGSLFQMLQNIVNNGGYIPLQRATTSILGGIKADIHNSIIGTDRYIEAKFKGAEGIGENDRLYLSALEIAEALNSLPSGSGLNIYTHGEGISIDGNVISNKVANTNERGGIRADIFSGLTSDETLVPVKFVNKDTPSLPSYEKLFIDAAEVLLSTQDYYVADKGIEIIPNQTTGVITWRIAGTYDSNNYGKYLKLDLNGNVIWDTVSSGTTYPPLTENSVFGEECVVVAPDKKEGFLRWDGVFATINPGDSFNITPLFNTGIKIAEYTRNNVSGDLYIPDSTYTPDYGIEIDNQEHTIGATVDYDANSNTFSANTSVTFRAHSDGGQGWPQIREAVVLRIDGNTNHELHPYNYYEIELNANDSYSNLNFEIDDQIDIMKGKPIYTLLTITAKTNVIVSVFETGRPRFININNAVVNEQLNPIYDHFLITLQFGIVRIEPLEYVSNE